VFGELVRDVSRTHPDVMLGAGTVDDAATAALFIARGANFIVGPTFRDDIARLCNRRKIPYLPGCMTLNEIALAEESGVEIVKLFPGSVGGPDFVKAVRGPRPWTRIMPTGGVSSDEANLKAWFGAGVAAVGMGSNLVKDDWVKAGDFSRITDETRRALETIRAIRVR
jgi:2-dehydro-3-deoxyphosphogluconate aldolase/(4S)-4-hydroxy-2-oxoglutarate aldolase